jgi:hypothetical protein
VDVSPAGEQTANFAYSTDGEVLHPIGTPSAMGSDRRFFVGYRYGIFNYATESLDGMVRVSSFTMTSP